MAYNIGVNVVEVDGVGAPAIVGAAVGVGAFNVQTERGVANQPARITSFAEYERSFGGYKAGLDGTYLVRGFFDNGGQAAWVNRVAPASTTTSSITLQDSASHDTLKLEGGNLGLRDPGSWAAALAVGVSAPQAPSVQTLFKETAPATVQGSPLSATTDMSSATPLSITVDQEASPAQIGFQPSDFANAAAATRQEIADAINRRQTKVHAALTADNRLALTSTGQTAALRGTFTSLQITAANAPLGLTANANPVFGTAAAPAAGGATLAKTDGLAPGIVVRLDDHGGHAQTVKLLTVTPTTGAVTWTPNIANIAQFAAPQTTIATVEFELAIAQGGTQDANVVERWAALSMEPDSPRYAPAVLNDPLLGSRYVVATNAHSSSGPGDNQPKPAAFASLQPGVDGVATAVDYVGDPGAHTGFFAFDPYDVQLVCSDRTDTAIAIAGLDYCQSRGDCMYVGSVPEASVGAGQAIAYGQALQGAKVYGALYGPWIKVTDPIGAGATPARWLAPTGHVMGVYARIASARGVWKAPAGDEARVFGALDVETVLSDADHTDLVKTGSVNGVRAIPGAGICVDASRTLSTDTRWLYVNVRLLFNYVKSSLRTGLRWVRQEPNEDSLWSAVKHGSVTPFLMGLWRQGAFGTGKPEDVFTVICDATNNPPSEVDQGILKVEVYFYPSRPAETIVIIVGQQPSGATAAEA